MVWKIMALGEKGLLIFEIRDENTREVSFSAFQYQKQAFLWQNLVLEEPWWVSLAGSTREVLLFQVYDDSQNPEHKSLLAVSAETGQLLWKKTGFSVNLVENGRISGFLREDALKSVSMDPLTGALLESEPENVLQRNKISDAVYPFQYLEGNSYFETIKQYLRKTLNVTAVMGAEYIETDGLIVISYYLMEDAGLANYLLAIREDGEILVHERLGGHLRGLGVETFFILSGYLFFVKNNREFSSYKLIQ